MSKKSMLAAVLFGVAAALPSYAAETYSKYVDEAGRISLPDNVRTQFVHLGSWAVADKQSGAHGLHDVYTERSSAEHYRKTGRFPDGATLVKEVRMLESGPLTTGNRVLWGTKPAVWFVMVKDAKGRFAGNPLWADGWGWALFKAEDRNTNVASSYEADCKGCHVPAAQTDRVFIQGYPTLRRE